MNNNSIRKCTLQAKSATNKHLFFQVAFINSVPNSLKWHFPLLLWTASTGVCEVSSLQKSHQEEILTLIKKQWQKELNIFLGLLQMVQKLQFWRIMPLITISPIQAKTFLPCPLSAFM